LDRFSPIVYNELLHLARIRLSGESPDRTLQATALVHEAYLNLVDHTRMTFQNRARLFAIDARIMRRILTDDARRRNTGKRGRRLQITLQENLEASDKKRADVLAVDLALKGLAKIDERKSRVVELKYFGGLTTEEISEVMGISVATVGRDLRVAHAWLHREMAGR
jgi:RNA polymerase sigma factor (TIGR02999 family)